MSDLRPWEKYKAKQAAAKKPAPKKPAPKKPDATPSVTAPVKPTEEKPVEPVDEVPAPAPPEDSLTPQGRLAAAEKALAPVAPELSKADEKVVEAYRRMYPERELDLSPMGIQAMTKWHEALSRADRPEADAAQRRYEIVQDLEKVYGERGLPLPEAYNVPFEERGIVGKVEEGLAQALPYLSPLLPDFYESSRKRKADIMPEPYFPERIAELSSYPERAAIDAIAGTELSKPYTEILGKTVRERPPALTRPEVETRGSMYGLREPSAIEENLEQELKNEENKMMDYWTFYAQNNPQKAARDPQFKGLLESQARKHMEAKSAERLRRIEALSRELDLVREYKQQLEREGR